MHPGAGFCSIDGTQLAAIGEDLLLGTTIGAYRVARLLGIGGMGRVYKGVHPTIGSRVAIKVLSRECSDRRDLVERFFAEAKAVNMIRHESIVNVLDLAMLPDGRPYIIMEYLDGAPLANLIDAANHQQHPLPLGGVARLAAEVLDALGAAHGKGIVHRDLKPDNVYVTPSGRPKVLDFGIAKLTDTTTGSSTRTGSLLGTPHYMAPEQAAGRPVDHRADIYAMGVILFECFTGRKPFNAEALFDLLRMHVEAPPPSPRQLRPDLPPELEHVIMVALAKQPDQRFANAQAMNMALQHATSQLSPDQWAPLSVTRVPTTNPGTWSPTPPASWGGRGTHPNAGPGHVSTVSAGEVTAHPRTPPPASPSRKGLWFAVIAVLLVGGGVTAAVVSQSSDASSAKPDVIAAETPSEPTPVETKPAETKPAEKKRTSIDLDEVKQDLEDMKTDLEGLKDLGEVVGGAMPSAASGWITRHSTRPPGWDPKKIDVDKFIDWAIAEAKRNIPDAQLTRMSVDGVYATGVADIVQVDGYIDLRFISPSRTGRPKNVPRGVKVSGRDCEFRIMGSDDGVEIYDMSDFGECKSVAISRPRCSMKQVWAKVRAMHKNIDDAVADITYMTNIVSHKIVWSFGIDDDDDKDDVSEMFADDC
jgi:serine/threonine protein kinase